MKKLILGLCLMFCAIPINVSAAEVRVNFGPANSTSPQDYILDDGTAYTVERGYGWDGEVFVEEWVVNADPRLNTMAWEWSWESSTWMYDLPNGNYKVSLEAGNSNFTHGPHTIEVEGVKVIDGQGGPPNQFFKVTEHPVTITDGQLNIKIGPSGGHSAINYVIIEDAVGGDPVNQAPSVEAGADQTITLPGMVVLTAEVSDDGLPSNQLISEWKQISGPAGATINNAQQTRTSVDFVQAGTYVFEIVVSDGELSAADRVSVVVNELGSFSDVYINFQPANDDVPSGYVKDDGSAYSVSRGYGWMGEVHVETWPNNADSRLNSMAWEWSWESSTWNYDLPNGNYLIALQSGNSNFTHGPHKIAVEGELVINGQGGAPNTFVLVENHPVTVADGQLNIKLGPSGGNSTINYVIIKAANGSGQVNQMPVVDAGADQQIMMDTAAQLDGAVSDDGLPLVPGNVEISWNQMSGPGTAMFEDVRVEDPRVTFTKAGEYHLQLVASDGELSASDEVMVKVTDGVPDPVDDIRVNFQPATSHVPVGYLVDDGSAYDNARGYGWLGDVRAEEWPNNTDQRLNTMVWEWSWETSTWVMDLPNGEYMISLEAGNTNFSHGPHVIEVEGQKVVDGFASSANNFAKVVNHPVTVTDGKLHVKLGPSGGNSTINYIIISQSGITPTNEPPVVSAGTDQNIVLPDSATLTAQVSDDGLPSPSQLSTMWSFQSGPAPVTIESEQSLQTQVNFTAGGTYIFRMTASDGVLSMTDDVTVMVGDDPVNNSVGLVAHWPMDESGGNIIVDRMGSGSDGMLINMEDGDFMPGQLRNGLEFDGVDEYANIGATPGIVISNEITVSAWVRSYSDGYGVIISRHMSGDHGWMLSRTPNNDSFEWRISTDGNNWFGGTTSDNSFETNQWYHVSASYDGDVMRVFIDGVEDTGGMFPFNVSGVMHKSDAPLQIARDEFNGDNFSFHGMLDDIRMYDIALSATEAQNLYNSVRPVVDDGSDQEVTFDLNGIPNIWDQNLLHDDAFAAVRMEPSQVGNTCFVDGTLGINPDDRLASGNIRQIEEMKYTLNEVPRLANGEYDIAQIKFYKTLKAATNRYSGCNAMGDRVLVRKGVYHEHLFLVEFQNYGGGDVADGYGIGPMDEPFVIDASDTTKMEGPWEAYDQEIYRAKWGLNVFPSWVVMDGNFRSSRPEYTLNAIVGKDGRFFYDTSTDYLYVNTSGVHPDDRSLIVSRHDDSNGLMAIISPVENIELTGFILRGAPSTGLWQTGDGAHVHHVKFEFCGRSCANLTDAQNSLIEKNIITAPVMQWWPRGRTSVRGLWPSGTQVGNGSTFRYNLVSNSGGEGVGTNGHDILVFQNVIRDSWSVNLYPSGSRNVTIEENLIYNTKVDYADGTDADRVPEGADEPYMRRRMRPIGILMGSEEDTDPLSINYVLRKNVLVNNRYAISLYALAQGSGWKQITMENNVIILPAYDPAEIFDTFYGLHAHGTVYDFENYFTDNIVINPAETGRIIGRIWDSVITNEAFTISGNMWYTSAGTRQFEYRQTLYDYQQWLSVTPYGAGSSHGTIPAETPWEINGQKIPVPDYIPVK